MVCVVFLGGWLLGSVLGFFLVLLVCYVLLLFAVEWKLTVFLLLVAFGRVVYSYCGASPPVGVVVPAMLLNISGTTLISSAQGSKKCGELIL